MPEALEGDFHHVELDIEQAMSKFKEDKDPEVRKDLLLEMRRLLREADSLSEAPNAALQSHWQNPSSSASMVVAPFEFILLSRACWPCQ